MKLHCYLYRKDFESSQLLSRIEDEQVLSVQHQKKIKELQVGEWNAKLTIVVANLP